MRVLVACEFSCTVRDAFRKRGHDAVSCDLLPTESEGPHYQCDVRDVLGYGWDLMIAHPPCTYLCSSGLHHNAGNPERQEKTEEALEFVRTLLDAPIPHIALENPTGCIGTRIRPASQWVHPYEFFEDASKNTGLWLKNVPRLKKGKRFPGRWVMWEGKMVERWSNQTDSGQNKEPPDESRWAKRSLTYKGIAEAMATQWTEARLAAQEIQLQLF